MSIIKTNLPALQAQKGTKQAQQRMATSLERLASGLRVNSAKDDAAGLAIANRMTANLRANSMLSRGVSDGIGLMQVAEGGLDGINELLQRSRELAVQAANGTLSDSDRANLNAEYKQLRAEIDRIATGTTAFGKYPLAPAPQASPAPTPPVLGNTPSITQTFPTSGSSGSFSSGIVSTAYIPAGATNVTLQIDSLGQDDDIQLFARNGTHLVGTPILGTDTDRVWIDNGITDGASAQALLLTPENGFLPGASYDAAQLLEGGTSHDLALSGVATGTYNGMTFAYSGDGDRYESGAGYNDGLNGGSRLEIVNIDKTTEDLVLIVVGSGAFSATATWDSMPSPTPPAPTSPPAQSPTSSDTDIVLGATFGSAPDKVTIKATPADSASLGLSDVELDPFEKAREAMKKLQEALNQVDGYRGQYGALTNRFEGAIANLAQQGISTAAARSRILDADYAVEIANMTRAQILQQGGTSVLSQANQIPQGVLSLLR
ncbi:flagellin [Pseudomonas sp. A-1]|uniref:flagellin N-terminal helical domain-containing protein n=1 Tax=Pseudomonas sp. A-1 TaxID=1821274 RepID=UPI0010A66257|nr:flagellin [Pseudomonas sp. A-1]THG80598.1 flagellin [Pseudomonas sp. A-1]